MSEKYHMCSKIIAAVISHHQTLQTVGAPTSAAGTTTEQSWGETMGSNCDLPVLGHQKVTSPQHKWLKLLISDIQRQNEQNQAELDLDPASSLATFLATVRGSCTFAPCRTGQQQFKAGNGAGRCEGFLGACCIVANSH